MTPAPDDNGTAAGQKVGDARPHREPPKLALWRRLLVWLLGKVPEPRSDRFGG